MKKYFHFIYSICLIGILCASCKKDISSPISNTNPTTLSQVFQDYWNQMNVNYVFWSIDTTNWDNVYAEYNPLFAQLDINNPNDVKLANTYFRQMADGLIDSHYNLGVTIPPVADSISPSLDRKLQKSNFHYPFEYTSIDTVNYLDHGFVSGNYTNSENQNIYAVSGTINNKILYFHCSQFALQEAYQSPVNNGVKRTLQYFFNQLQNLPANIKGIVIDVRNNPGGSVSDLSFLTGQFIDAPLKIGYTRYKSGNGRLSYTPWIEADVAPQLTGHAFTIPIIVLADNFSASLAEATTISIHTLPNGIFVGETTWGATGAITENSLYNDGQFNVGNFLSVYTSSAQFEYIDGKSYEGIGYTPDFAVPFNLAAAKSGDDLILDKAISLIQ